MNQPLFAATEVPRSIIDRAGTHLATRFVDFAWRPSRQALVQTVGQQRRSISLQSSTHSRTGVGTWVNVTILVQDNALKRWRVAHPDLASRGDAFLLSLPLRSLHGGGDVELFGPLRAESGEYLSLKDLAELLATEVVPVLRHLDSPAAAAEGLPDAWLMWSVSVSEWARSRGDDAAAQRILDRGAESVGSRPRDNRPVIQVLSDVLAANPTTARAQVVPVSE